jgi:hypothetical protein
LHAVGVFGVRTTSADALDSAARFVSLRRFAALTEDAYAATWSTKPRNPRTAAAARTLAAYTHHPSARGWTGAPATSGGVATMARDARTEPSTATFHPGSRAIRFRRRPLPSGTGAFDTNRETAHIYTNLEVGVGFRRLRLETDLGWPGGDELRLLKSGHLVPPVLVNVVRLSVPSDGELCEAYPRLSDFI